VLVVTGARVHALKCLCRSRVDARGYIVLETAREPTVSTLGATDRTA